MFHLAGYVTVAAIASKTNTFSDLEVSEGMETIRLPGKQMPCVGRADKTLKTNRSAVRR
jgi:hypothetical protein